MIKVLKKMAYLLSVPLIAILLLLSPVFVSGAATLTTAYVVLSRMQANLTSTANLELYIAFECSGSVSSGSTLTLEFPDGDDGSWCRVVGSDLVVSGVTSTPGDSTGAYNIDSALPGTLTASCSKGSGSNSVDTITVTGLTALSSGSTYGLKLSNGSTAKLGTSTAGQKIVTLTVDDGTDPETKSFGINLVSNDQVQISAEVVNPPTVTCSLDSNSVNLGNLYRGGMYVTGSHTLTASTSDNAAGYFWVAYGQGDGSTNAGLYKSTATTYLIASDNGSATVDISDPGSEGFGMNVTVPSGEAVAGSGFGDNSAGVFGSLGMGPSNAELISYRNWGPQTTSAVTTITYGARAGSSAEPGTYSETVTFFCGGYIGGYESEPEMSGMSLPSTTVSDSSSGGTATWSSPENAQAEDGEFTYSLVGTGGTCLSKETLIWTEEGNVPISDMSIGDMVYSYNLDTEEIELSEVGNVWSSPITEAQGTYYNIYYGSTYVKATYNHRFYVKGKYILAQNLRVGDVLLDMNNQERVISNIVLEENSTDYVWDLSVNGNHNFFANGVLVHNAGVYDDKVRIVKGGSIGSTDRATANAWQSTPTHSIYGGPTDLWGETWTAEDLNSTNFGVAISSYGSGYTTYSTSEYLKTSNFGLSVPTGATIHGIEVRVRRRLRNDSGNIYSDIDFVNVKVYYEEPTWTLDFGDIQGNCFGGTDIVTIPENVTLYLEMTSGAGVSVNSGALNIDWYNNSTKSFLVNDLVTIYMGNCIKSPSSGSITIRIDDATGRIVSEFDYYLTYDFCDPCPAL